METGHRDYGRIEPVASKELILASAAVQVRFGPLPTFSAGVLDETVTLALTYQA